MESLQNTLTKEARYAFILRLSSTFSFQLTFLSRNTHDFDNCSNENV